jgi:alkylation response protein AidB-like acyl-CoA dehydrogenase
MDLDYTPDQTAFRHELREFLEERLPDRWVGIFHGPAEHLEASFAITREMAERGWLTQLWPEEFGGNGASIWRQAVLQEETWAYFEPRGGQYMGVNWIGPSIIAFGTEEQKSTHLPPIAAGAVQWAQLFSEPDAGSDLANLRTRAELDGDEWVINGEKTWTSYGDIADFGFLVARCEPGSRRHHGIVVLLIDMRTPGIKARPIETPLGHHKINVVSFDNARVPATAVLGEPGDGWRVAMAALGFERTGVARYARATRMIGELERQPTADDPLHRARLVECLADARVAELMNHRVVALREAGESPRWEGSAARISNVTLERNVAQLSDDMLGPVILADTGDDHTIEDGELEDFARLAPTGNVTTGAYEIQMGIIAQHGLGLQRVR